MGSHATSPSSARRSPRRRPTGPGWDVRVAGPAALAADVAPAGGPRRLRPGRDRRPAAAGDVAVVRRLRALARGADVLHAHGLRAGALAVLAARSLPPGRRPRVVVTLHNLPVGGRAIRTVSAGARAGRRARAPTSSSGCPGTSSTGPRGLGASGPPTAPSSRRRPRTGCGRRRTGRGARALGSARRAPARHRRAARAAEGARHPARRRRAARTGARPGARPVIRPGAGRWTDPDPAPRVGRGRRRAAARHAGGADRRRAPARAAARPPRRRPRPARRRRRRRQQRRSGRASRCGCRRRSPPVPRWWPRTRAARARSPGTTARSWSRWGTPRRSPDAVRRLVDDPAARAALAARARARAAALPDVARRRRPAAPRVRRQLPA